MQVRGVKRTPGISNPVDVRMAFLHKLADEDHARAEVEYVKILERRDQQRSFVSRVKRALRLGR